MLRSVRLLGFKSYRDATLDLAPLTVLIGANASGKSNALEGLRLLSWVAQGNRLGTIRHEIGDRAIRGTVASLGFRGEAGFRLGCATTDTEWDRYEIGLRLNDDGDFRIDSERITGQGTKVPLFDTVGHVDERGGDLRVAYNNFARGGKKPQVTCADQVAVLTQLESAARFEAGHREAQSTIPEVCGRYRALLSDILFLDPRPGSMRGYSHKSERRLNDDGSNVSGVLYHLCHADSNKARQEFIYQSFGGGTHDALSATPKWTDNPSGNRLPLEHDRQNQQAILNLIRSLPEQDISAIDFIETPRDEVMITLQETFGGTTQTYDATLLSDGTLRVLSIAAAVLSAPTGSLVVIEEIDNGIHPSRADGILRSISDIAKARDLNVLISSHNPALLDALPDDAVPNTVFCYRDPADGSSRLVRLDTLPDYPELIALGSLGHLLTQGLIDRFVKTHPGVAEKKAKAETWLRRLREDVG